jgi:hypothetical protein
LGGISSAVFRDAGSFQRRSHGSGHAGAIGIDASHHAKAEQDSQ